MIEFSKEKKKALKNPTVKNRVVPTLAHALVTMIMDREIKGKKC